MSTPVETILDHKKHPVRNFVHDTQNSAPSSPVEGQEYFNTETKKKQHWNGSRWVKDIEIATDEQTSTGTAEDVAINPKQLKAGLDTKQASLGYTAESTSNKVTSISSSSTDTQYPSAKLLYDQLALKAPIASPEFTGTPKSVTPTTGDNSTKIATTAFVATAIAAALTGGLIYKGAWNTTSASDYSALNSYRPILKGWMFKVIGTGCVIDSVDYKSGDLIIFNRDVSDSTTITTATIDKYDHTQSEDTVLLDAIQTITNKTINASNNTISNLATSMFASGVILTALSNSPSDTALLTEKATKTLLDLKAPLASPALTGTPTAPTAPAGTNTTQIASTAFVKDTVDTRVSGLIKKETYNNPALTLADDGTCTWTITHTLGSQHVDCRVFEASTGKRVITDEEATSSTTFTITFTATANIAANTYKAVLEG